MAGPNAMPLRGHRKDQMFVHLVADFTGGLMVVDTAATDMEFWTTTVGDAAGTFTFNFKVGYGARRAVVVGSNLDTAAAPGATGYVVQVLQPSLTAGTMVVRTVIDTGGTAADPAAAARLSVTLSLETL